MSVSPPTSDENIYWKRNLAVCLVGCLTTIIAMTIMIPFLPLYVEELGVTGHANIAQWSGIVYGATFFSAALVAPLWGRLGDRYGRKVMLVRASLGMAIAMSLIGMAENIWQLFFLRLFAGLAGGYASGSVILVASQTPKFRSGWALGLLSSGIMAGSLIGPLIGGTLPNYVGLKQTFWLSGAIIFLAFLATVFLIKEEKKDPTKPKIKNKFRWSDIPDKRPVIVMFFIGSLLMFANLTIEPIITLYVAQINTPPDQVVFISGLAMSAAALGSILSASRLGRLADRIGPNIVITIALLASVILLIPQAFISSSWQLIFLRFLMGLALGGLLPCVTSVVRHSVPDNIVGGVLGTQISAQYIGQVLGTLFGGFVGGHIGISAVFIGTSALMAIGAALMLFVPKPGYHKER
ncbi:MFS transporter [Microvirga sp. W0021]|uniref:MFS transporter n=1 Tax=Hohaiivirga grylli TaxID=3133970 RepID=A0ABV0BJC2_9HYPH